MKYTYKIVVGDWSDDGHSQKDFFHFKCTHDSKTIKKAYLDAVKKSKISLHDNHGKSLKDITPICCDYEDNRISREVFDALMGIGVDLSKKLENIVDEDEDEDEDEDNEDDEEIYIHLDDIPVIFLEMVKSQIEGFKYQLIEDEIECINGFWSKDFNHSFGYGCYN